MAHCFVKLVDQIIFWVNQLMSFSFALIPSCNKGPFDSLRTSLWKTKRTLLNTFGWLLAATISVTISH